MTGNTKLLGRMQKHDKTQEDATSGYQWLPFQWYSWKCDAVR
jgi:hypothetical protein